MFFQGQLFLNFYALIHPIYVTNIWSNDFISTVIQSNDIFLSIVKQIPILKKKKKVGVTKNPSF